MSSNFPCVDEFDRIGEAISFSVTNGLVERFRDVGIRVNLGGGRWIHRDGTPKIRLRYTTHTGRPGEIKSMESIHPHISDNVIRRVRVAEDELRMMPYGSKPKPVFLKVMDSFVRDFEEFLMDRALPLYNSPNASIVEINFPARLITTYSREPWALGGSIVMSGLVQVYSPIMEDVGFRETCQVMEEMRKPCLMDTIADLMMEERDE